MLYKNKHLAFLLEALNMTLLDLGAYLQIPVKDLESVQDFETGAFSRNRKKALTPNDSATVELLEDLYFTVREFARYKMSPARIHKILAQEVTFSGKTLSLLELTKIDDYLATSRRREIVDNICFEYFKESRLGPDASSRHRLNREVAEEVFNQKVEAKLVWEYSETGDYQVPQIQAREEVFDDGSELWNKLKSYSTNIQDAWLIVDFLGKTGVQVRLSNKAMQNDYWWCYMDEICVQASTPAEAICEAAIKLIRSKKV